MKLRSMPDSWRKGLEDTLRSKFGGNVALELDDMIFFDYYNNHFDGYWFRLHDNLTGQEVVGFIADGMDSVDYHIEYIYLDEKPLTVCCQTVEVDNGPSRTA